MTKRTIAVAALAVITCMGPERSAQNAPHSTTPKIMAPPGAVTTVAKGLEHPWGLEFLPDGRILVTERPGRLRIVSRDGKLSAPLTGVPAVYARGQGGLLDVALDPAFAKNQVIYLSFAEEDDGLAGTAVARARLGASGLTDVRVIYRQQPKVMGGGHYGSRIVFRRDGTIFVTQGERMNYRERPRTSVPCSARSYASTPTARSRKTTPLSAAKT